MLFFQVNKCIKLSFCFSWTVRFIQRPVISMMDITFTLFIITNTIFTMFSFKVPITASNGGKCFTFLKIFILLLFLMKMKICLHLPPYIFGYEIIGVRTGDKLILIKKICQFINLLFKILVIRFVHFFWIDNFFYFTLYSFNIKIIVKIKKTLNLNH